MNMVELSEINPEDRENSILALLLTDAGEISETTLFGSSRKTAISAGSLLRARAAAAGAQLKQVDGIDLVAGVIATECWMIALHSTTLGHPVKHGSSAVKALAAILARVAGHSEVQVSPTLIGSKYSAGRIRALELLADWADLILGQDGSLALHRAAADLSAGSEDPRIEDIASLLVIIADNRGS